MLIDCGKLELKCVQRYSKPGKEEYYFKVPIPELSDFAISTYLHLLRKSGDSWITPDLRFRYANRKGTPIPQDYYVSVKTPKKKHFQIGLTEIARRTFFPDAKKLIWPKSTTLFRDNVSSHNGYCSKDRPVMDITQFYVCDSLSDFCDYIISKINGTYQAQHHELINIPELPKSEIQPKDPKPQVLDDWTPVNPIEGLTIELINRKYADMTQRATNENYKSRPDKIRYKNTTKCKEWDNRLAFQHWMNENYYYYPGEVLELDKDLFGLCEADEYAPKYCCFLPPYINTIFTTSRNDSKGKPYYGYGIQHKVTKRKRLDRWIVPTGKLKRTGFYRTCAVYDTYIEALISGRKVRADKIRSVVAYEKNRGYIPSGILGQLQKVANLIEAGKIKELEPDNDIFYEVDLSE